LLCM